MDFLALPRRDLQALCKRNGVRANMTNAAMAEALAALPTVDGIEEYIKQPVAVPAPAAKAVVQEAEEVEPRLEKQGSPLPRGRRVTAKTKEPTKPEDAKQANATLEQNTEDAPAPRRGASRRARPAPVVPKPTGKASAEEEKQGSSPLVEDGEAEEDLKKREASKEDAPAAVLGRRGASRRARPAPAADSAGAGVGEEQREKGSLVPPGLYGAVKPAYREETTEENLKQKAGTDDAPAHGVGRRGPSRRARPATAMEEQMAPIPRGRNLKAKSSEPIKVNDGEEDDKECGKQKDEADDSAPVVGRRGASRRARRAPAVDAPSGNVAAQKEPTAPIQGSQSVSVKSPEVIRLDDSEADEKEDMKSEEKVEDLPAIGAGRCGGSRRAPAPAEAPATRRRAATSKPEAGDVTMETMPIRSTRQRKPTMKAVAAAEEKAPRRAARRGAVRKNVLQQEEQEEPLGVVSDAEAVPTPVSDQGCDGPGDLEVQSDPQNEEQNKVVDQPKQEDEDVVIIEDEVLMVQTPVEDPLVSSQKCVVRSALQEQQVDDEKSSARLDSQEDSPILGLVSMAARVDKVANFEDIEGSNEEPWCEEILDAGEEPRLAARESTKEVAGDANHESEMRDLNEVLHSREEISEVDTEDDLVSQEKKNIDVDELRTELVNETILFDCSGTISTVEEEKTNEVNIENSLGCQHKGDVAVDTALDDREEIREVDTEDDLVCQEKENMDVHELQTKLVDEAVLFDCSVNISLVNEEKTNEVNTEDGPGCQQKRDVAVDTVLPCMADDAVLLDFSDKNIEDVQEEVDIMEVTNEMRLDEDGGETALRTDTCDAGKQNQVASLDNTGEVAVENSGAVEEKSAVVTSDMPHNIVLVDEDDKETETHSDEQQEVVTSEKEPEADVGCFLGKAVLDKMQQTMATEDEVIGDDHVDTDFDLADAQMKLVADDNVPVQAGANCQVIAQEKAAVFTEEMPQSTATIDEDIEENQFQAVSADQAVATSNSLNVYMTDDEFVEEEPSLIIDEIQQSTATIDEDIEENQFQAVSADQAVATSNSLNVYMTDDEFVEEEPSLIIDEIQQSTVTMIKDAVDDHFETAVVHADEQEQEVATENVKELTGAVVEIVKEADKAVVITEDVPQCLGTVAEYVEEDKLKINFAHAGDNVTEMRQTEDDIVQKENVFTNDLPQHLDLAGDCSDHITSALLDDVTDSLSKSNITLVPTESASSVCNNSSEKNTTELSVVMQEEKGVKVAKNSVDLTNLSMRQLRIKIKEKLNAKKNKEAKRVALARVDENVCRSQSKGQQQNLNLQQH
ncbi:unnamed protein product [Urochloa humidicola]